MPGIGDELVRQGHAVAQMASQIEIGPVLDLAAVVLPTILAVAAAVMTTLTLESEQSRRNWRIGLMAFGVLISFATWGQQTLSRRTNEAEAKLRYEPYLVVEYRNHRLQIDNIGKSNIFYWGYSLLGLDNDKEALSDGLLIPFGASFAIPGENFESMVVQKIGQNGAAHVQIDFYLKNELQIKYISHNSLFLLTKNSDVEVRPQMLSVVARDW
jgi:hypothetical protein